MTTSTAPAGLPSRTVAIEPHGLSSRFVAFVVTTAIICVELVWSLLLSYVFVNYAVPFLIDGG